MRYLLCNNIAQPVEGLDWGEPSSMKRWWSWWWIAASLWHCASLLCFSKTILYCECAVIHRYIVICDKTTHELIIFISCEFLLHYFVVHVFYFQFSVSSACWAVNSWHLLGVECWILECELLVLTLLARHYGSHLKKIHPPVTTFHSKNFARNWWLSTYSPQSPSTTQSSWVTFLF